MKRLSEVSRARGGSDDIQLEIDGDQTRQASIPLSIVIAQNVANLIHWQPFVGEFCGFERLAGADRAMRSMLIAIAVEQALMTEFLVASAVTMKLRQQRRVFCRDFVGLARRTEEAIGVERIAADGS